MTEYKEMLVDTELQHGDRVTFAQSREGELLRLFASKHKDGRLGVILAEEFMDISRLLGRGLKIVQVDRPVPKVELPTVPGYYSYGNFELSDGVAAYRLHTNGDWSLDGQKVPKQEMREITPLTRLVPAPAKLVDRLDLELVGRVMDDISERDYATHQEDGAVLIAAIDNGELDK